jgi:cytochrome oxidase Cu insertion factor (SCO1/SenC/PrrC family)
MGKAIPVEVASDAAVTEQPKSCCKADDALATEGQTLSASPIAVPSRKITIPDVRLLDQDGREVRFYQDLVKNKIAAINFIFTSCKAACPLLGAGFSKLQERLGERLAKECALISVSVDPAVDRPDRLKAWASQFGARAGWTQVTAADGGKHELDTLLKGLQVYSPEKTSHSQSVLVVDGDSLEGWSSQRTAGTDELMAMIDLAIKTRGGRNYFTDATLIDQDGHRLRFYSDLIKGKVVVIHPFFTSCTGSCVTMADTLTKLQDRLGNRLGNQVVLISLTVDPATDKVQRLAEHARKVNARPGWHLLTGEKNDLEEVERKLGQYVPVRESHSTTMIVGNEASGLWFKHLDPRDVNGLLARVEEALADGRDAPLGPR